MFKISIGQFRKIIFEHYFPYINKLIQNFLSENLKRIFFKKNKKYIKKFTIFCRFDVSFSDIYYIFYHMQI